MELVCLDLVPVGSVQMYKNLETSEEGEFQVSIVVTTDGQDLSQARL